MLFLVALQNFVVLHSRTAHRVIFAADKAEDGFNYVTFADDNDSNELVFSCGAEIVQDNPLDPSSFYVEDTDGDKIYFNAYTPAFLSSPFRVTYNLEEPNRLCAQAGKFDVHLNHTDEGIIVDVWPYSVIGDYAGETLATCSVSNDDADDALEEDDR